MKFSALLLSLFFCLNLYCQTSGASYISTIESKANQIEQNDQKVASLNRQHMETYNLESSKLAALKKELSALLSEKELVLDDYRNGYFCGGCGKPRSQFGPSETFPHSGQKIVPATKEQVAAKEKEYDDKISRKKEEIKQFEFNENEFTRKRADIDKQMSALKDESDRLRREIVQLSSTYKDVVVKAAASIQSLYLSELMRIVAEKHFIEDRINILTVKIADLNSEEIKALSESAENVRKQTENEKQKANNQIEANKAKLIDLLQSHQAAMTPLQATDATLKQKRIDLKAQLKNTKNLTAEQTKALEDQINEVEQRIAQLANTMQEYESRYESTMQKITNENKVLADKVWDLTINLTKKQQDASDQLKKAFSLRRKILEDAKVARQKNLQLTGELLLNKKSALRNKFMEYATEADKERIRLVRACDKAGCGCYGIDTHGTIVGNWNKGEGCIGQMEGAHFSDDAVYGCTEEASNYRQYYSSLVNGLSDSDIKALQKQSGKVRYDLILNKITN